MTTTTQTLEQGLPELPDPDAYHIDTYTQEEIMAHSNEQMRAYALAAIEADRKKRDGNQVSAGLSKEDVFVVGRLPTVNQDGYPGLRPWWVQVWHGEYVFARAYGDSPEQATANAQRIARALESRLLAASLPNAPIAAPATKGGE